MSSGDKPRRGQPYAWVTWVTALLARTDQCKWKAWYRSHFTYAKRPEDRPFDLAKWTEEHDAMVTRRVELMKAEGWEVRVEEENAFKLQGKNATLAGKADILGLRADDALVIDAKSGKPKEKDRWQVLVYMFALPLTYLKGKVLRGAVEYPGDQMLQVPPAELDAEAKGRISEVMQMIGSPQEPPRTPSPRECGYCDIAACPQRVNASGDSVADATGYF